MCVNSFLSSYPRFQTDLLSFSAKQEPGTGTNRAWRTGQEPVSPSGSRLVLGSPTETCGTLAMVRVYPTPYLAVAAGEPGAGHGWPWLVSSCGWAISHLSPLFHYFYRHLSDKNCKLLIALPGYCIIKPAHIMIIRFLYFCHSL